jgi:hypothetical protein
MNETQIFAQGYKWYGQSVGPSAQGRPSGYVCPGYARHQSAFFSTTYKSQPDIRRIETPYLITTHRRLRAERGEQPDHQSRPLCTSGETKMPYKSRG